MLKVLEGKYKGKGVIVTKTAVSIAVGIIKVVLLSQENIRDYEVVTEEHKKSASSGIARGIVGSALLGPVGMLGGVLSAKSKGNYHVVIEWQDGEKSLIELDSKGFKAMQRSFFR